jgi:hypothetical protein
MDHLALFREIENLDLHLCEPRFGCAARAHNIGKFLKDKQIPPGKIWALPASTERPDDGNSVTFHAPCFMDMDGKPFAYSYLGLPPNSENKAIVEDTSRGFAIQYHVAASDIRDWLNPVIHDPVLFSGPVSLGRWMSVFNRSGQVKFVKTEWGVAPVNSWMGLTYAPGYASEHSPYTDDDYARIEFMELRNYSPKGIAYSRHNPSFRATL